MESGRERNGKMRRLPCVAPDSLPPTSDLGCICWHLSPIINPSTHPQVYDCYLRLQYFPLAMRLQRASSSKTAPGVPCQVVAPLDLSNWLRKQVLNPGIYISRHRADLRFLACILAGPLPAAFFGVRPGFEEADTDLPLRHDFKELAGSRISPASIYGADMTPGTATAEGGSYKRHAVEACTRLLVGLLECAEKARARESWP